MERDDRCFVELPGLDGTREFECGIVVLMLSVRERSAAEGLASRLGGSLHKHQYTECWGRAYIAVPRGSEAEALASAAAEPEVLLVDLNYLYTLEVNG